MPTPMNAKMFVSGAVSTAIRQRISATRGSSVIGIEDGVGGGAEADAAGLGGTAEIGGVVGGLDGVRTLGASDPDADADADAGSEEDPDADTLVSGTGSSPATEDAATHRDRIGSCTHVALVIEPIAASRLSSMKSTGPNVLPSCDQCHCARESVGSVFMV